MVTPREQRQPQRQYQHHKQSFHRPGGAFGLLDPDAIHQAEGMTSAVVLLLRFHLRQMSNNPVVRLPEYTLQFHASDGTYWPGLQAVSRDLRPI